MKAVYIISLVFVSTVLLADVPRDSVKLLQWAGPPGSRPGTFKEWIVSHPYTKFSVRLDKTVIGNRKAGAVAILINSTIASSLTSEVHRLMVNLQWEGYTVSSYEVSGGTPASLRSFLEDLYTIDNIEGALFIGDLPVAWFQVGMDYNSPIYGYAEWPIDLFYMDLDGNWLDILKHGVGDTLVPGQDGIYDTHSGDVSPEIYIGRLTPTGIGNDTLLIKNYFSKDNAYRYHTIELQHRALVYIDDDWEPWASHHAWEVSLLYPDILVVSDSNTTIASDYKVRLDTVRAWVSVFAHSWPGGHAFYYNDHTSTDTYWATEYTSQDPPSNFYNHFCCYFARYTTNGYGGGRAIFTQTYGVGAIGSTKTGSMLDFDYFYQPLSEGKTIGTAFKEWWDYIASGGITFSELCWHYGMTLLGDPFLKPTGHPMDTLSPQISNTTVWSDTSFQGPFPVYSTITDNWKVSKSQLWYKTSVDTNWASLQMDTTIANEYLAEIPFQPTIDTVWYYIYCEDIALPPNSAKKPVNAPDSCYSFITGYVGTEQGVPKIPKAFFVSQNYPNPFTSSTEIEYGFPEDTNINITIYNISGKKVAVLVNEKKKAGYYTVRWNGENKYGKKVANGIYFYRLESCSHTATKKMYFIK